MTIPVYLLTNDNHLWLIQGFAYLFNQHWSVDQPVIVVGFNRPAFDLPENFAFASLGERNLPAQEWSTGLLRMLKGIKQDHFILFLEDYWLTADVNQSVIASLYNWVTDKPDVLRIDLTNNRASQRSACLPDDYNLPGVDLVETPAGASYQMSFQVGIWNKKLLRLAIKSNESPWESEIYGTQRLAGMPFSRVLGTRQEPIVYTPVYRTRTNRINLNGVPPSTQKFMRGQGWI